jgi:cyclohexanone monooxygenase
MDNFNILINGGHQDEDLVADGWTDIFRSLLTLPKFDEPIPAEEFARYMEVADFKKMEQVRGRVDALVEDPELAESLKPYYRQFCKRPTFNDEYLQTFNRPNVTLVDTKGRGVSRITEKGVEFDGVEYELDCIIFATGFEVGTAYTRRSGYEVVGRDGLALTDKWADGMKTLHGFQSNGFPNCFFMGLTQGSITANFTHTLNEQSNHIAYIIKHVLDAEATTIEATPEAEADWVDTIRRTSRQNLQYQAECTPGYYNNEGQIAPGIGFTSGQYGGGPIEFFRIMKEWRDEDALRGCEVR